MRTRIVLCFIVFSGLLVQFGPIRLKAADLENIYDVKKIPSALLKDADAVIRVHSIRLDIKNTSRAVETVRFAVTILKKEKRDYGLYILGYDKFSRIKNFEGTIYDSTGKEIRTLESDEKKDYSAVSGYSLYEDSRMQVAEMYHNQYPYTIEYTYDYIRNEYFSWPAWQPQEYLDAVQEARFEVLLPVDDSLRYWCSCDSLRPVEHMDEGRHVYVWDVQNLPKLSRDAAGSNSEDYSAIVYTAPRKFEIDGYAGDLTAWKNFGIWEYGLYTEKDALPESAHREIRSIVQPSEDDYNKIRKVYRYMQERTRYVSVQIGIGGWQPFDATCVHEHGYGDCKALSNYMVSLLKAAGITAYTFLVHHGNDRFPFIEEFPSNQFNHAMVCVPLQKDTIWLECTSQSIPFGHIGCETENRGVLLITPEGGKVIHTPSSSPAQNMQCRTAAISLAAFGGAEVNSLEIRNGDQQDEIRGGLFAASPEEREHWILNDIDVPNAVLKKYSLSGLETHENQVGLLIQFSVKHYASATGSRLFFQPNMLERNTAVPPDAAERLAPVRFSYPYLDVDTLVYHFPKGFTAESLPPEAHVESSFGRFSSKTIVTGDTTLIFTRSLEIHDYSVPAKNYKEYRKFFWDIVKADRAQVVLVKK